MKPLFELPELLDLSGDVFASILTKTFISGYGCCGGCLAGCCGGCAAGTGIGAVKDDEDPPVG